MVNIAIEGWHEYLVNNYVDMIKRLKLSHDEPNICYVNSYVSGSTNLCKDPIRAFSPEDVAKIVNSMIYGDDIEPDMAILVDESGYDRVWKAYALITRKPLLILTGGGSINETLPKNIHVLMKPHSLNDLKQKLEEILKLTFN